jgi:hypothetical protein
VLTQQVEPENRNGRLDAAATLPAETSDVRGATPSEEKSGSRVAAVGSPGRAPYHEGGPG